MKRITLMAVLAILTGCGTPKKEKTQLDEYKNIDSLLQCSEKNANLINEANRRSDTSIASKVDKTVKKIVKMEGEIKQLKAENNELKEKLNDANDDGKPFNIRSISNN